MISNSKNPFQPSPKDNASKTKGTPPPSPFGAAAPVTMPDPAKPSAAPNSPFAVAKDAKASAASSFEQTIAEPTEGFAAPDAMSSAPKAPSNGSKTGSTQRKGRDFVLPSEAAPAPVTSDTPQLVLRAIFGVDRELNRDEILQRGRALPGIHNLHIVVKSETTAMAVLREGIQRMGFGDQAKLEVTTNTGVVDFVEEPGTTLAVLHEGTYAPGVRETLIFVARELALLG